MKNKTYKLMASIILFGVVFGLNVKNAQAGPGINLSEPIMINGYSVNVEEIIAEDSLLWPLLANFSRIDGNFSQCVTDTTALVQSNETEMRALFPWFWNGGDISYGVSTFCYILDEIPDFAEDQMINAGLTFGKYGGTNIFDGGVIPDWHNINGLVFDHPLGTIEFTGTVDLLSYDFVHLLLSFAQAFDIKQAYLSLDSELVQGLKETGAIITMKNVPDFDEPVILVDGVIDASIVPAIVYDKEAKTITFNANHFTSFQAVESPSIPVEEEEKDDDKKRPKIYSAKIERLTYADGRDYYKVTAKGKNYDKKFNMYLGGRKSIKETRVNKRRAIGYFNVADFENEPQETLKFKVYNSSKRKRTYDHRLPIYNIPHQYMN